jgi:hypothetical protein
MIHVWIIWGFEFIISTLISPPLIRGTLDGNYAYTAGVDGKPGVYRASGAGILSILRQDILGDKKLTVLDHPREIFGIAQPLPRWQLINKQYYGVTYQVSGGDTTGSFNSITLEMIEALNAIPRHGGDFLTNYGPHLGPISGAFAGQEEPIIRRIFFDFWALGDKRYELYYTEPHLGNRLTRKDFHPMGNRRPEQSPEGKWKKVGEWAFDWTGPFYVAAVGDDRYFVTDTGRVFFAPKIDRTFAPEVHDFGPRRAVKPETQLKELWKGPPVDALIHDADAKTWYAFTKDRYFKIADPIKPKPHTIPFRREWTANKALESAVLCGRVIRGLPAPTMTERTWDDLASPEPRVGHKAVWANLNEPARAVALLKERLKPVPSPPAKELAALIDDLGSESFAKREAAQKRLREFGHTIEPILREAVSTAATPEGKRRLNQLLTDCQSIASRTPDEIRAVRAVQMLERIGNPESRQLLEACAKGADAAILTRQARQALKNASP